MQTVASLLSSFFANRLRAALWIAAVALAIGLVVGVLLGFRPHRAASLPVTRRELVAAYIQRVDRIEVAMAPQVRAIDREYKLFAKDPKGLAARVPAYRRAEGTLALLARRLAAVDPPREARKLQGLLVQLANANASIAKTVSGLAVYLPSLVRVQRPLQAAIAALRTGIHKGKTAKAQAGAFATYSTATATIADAVAALRPPHVFAQARTAELSQLRELSSIASAIEDALLHKHAKVAQRLVAQLGQVEAGTTVVRAQRAGAAAFDATLQHVSRLAKQIEAERKRLEKRLSVTSGS